MAGEQGDLLLGNETMIPGESASQFLPDVLKRLERARKALGLVKKAEVGSVAEKINALDKAIAALRALDPVPEISELEREHSVLVEDRDEALRDRRENLLQSAQVARWPFKRLKEYDYVGGFRVNYKLERVTLVLGSELLTTFEETDGGSLFSRIQEEKSKLDEFPFARDAFIETIKTAIHIARCHGTDRNGKVPIRSLYPMIVLARQSHDRRFLKRPVARSFKDYTMAQFVYDLARFGREGWKTDTGDRLCNQGPNMASIAKGATVILPKLDGDGSGGEQLGVVWIDRA